MISSMMTRILSTLALLHCLVTTQAWAATKASAWRQIQEPTICTRLFEKDNESVDNDNVASTRRRQVGASLVGLLAAVPLPSHAGEVGARITKAVTESDLGVSVRRSVVRGAQVMDKMDGQWEQFSDRFGLGAERSKQEGRPKPKVIPDPKPLDSATVQQLLDMADQTFSSLAGVRPNDLVQRISKIDGLVRPSFERTGLSLSDDGKPLTGAQFNYASYVHFKAYDEYMVESKKPFAPFYRDFQKQLGQQLLSLFSSTQQQSPPKDGDSSKEASLEDALKSLDALCDSFVSKGFVAATERSEVDVDRLADWVDDLGDYQFSVALDGDVTLSSQILLQEQGFRLYPNYGRFAVFALLSNRLPTQKVTVEEYYMDTDYSSDPDKFEVKEVLLNIVLENP